MKMTRKATLEVQKYLCISPTDQNLRDKIAFNPASLTLDGVTSFFLQLMDVQKHTKNTRFNPKIMLCSRWLISIPFAGIHLWLNISLFTFAMFRGLRNKSKTGCKDQESVQSSTTPDPGYHTGN